MQFDMHKRMMLAVSAAALLASAAAFAQNNPSNLEKLGQFKATGASPNIPTISQGGVKAEALKKNLEKIKLPHGFHIGLYAIVPDARHMAVGPQGVVTFVGTRKSQGLCCHRPFEIRRRRGSQAVRLDNRSHHS